jgi:hypothetical protein
LPLKREITRSRHDVLRNRIFSRLFGPFQKTVSLLPQQERKTARRGMVRTASHIGQKVWFLWRQGQRLSWTRACAALSREYRRRTLLASYLAPSWLHALGTGHRRRFGSLSSATYPSTPRLNPTTALLLKAKASNPSRSCQSLRAPCWLYLGEPSRTPSRSRPSINLLINVPRPGEE